MKNETSREPDALEKAIEFVVAIYKVTETFPKEEKFGLTSQLRRASVSIVTNISEGAARRSSKEFRQFLSHSQGSASEVDTELVIALAELPQADRLSTFDERTRLHWADDYETISKLGETLGPNA